MNSRSDFSSVFLSLVGTELGLIAERMYFLAYYEMRFILLADFTKELCFHLVYSRVKDFLLSNGSQTFADLLVCSFDWNIDGFKVLELTNCVSLRLN